MALAQVANQLLRSAGEGTEVVVNSPITGNGTSEQPLGIDENWHGQDGESVTFTISAIPSGTRVTLSGAQGTESFDVMNGVDGTNGTDGAQGPAGPQGPQGDPGVPGETGPQGIQGERGPAGPQGEQGEQGPAGQDGAPGKSAYEIAVEDGFSGNVYEWLESLKGDPGEDGKNAYELAVEAGFTGTSAEWLDSLVGPQGPEGPSGASGASGFSPTVSTTPITTGTSGTQVTITDLTGSHTFDIMNGAKGDQGPSGESYTGSLMPLIGDNGIAVTSNAGNAVVEISSVAHDATISGNGTVSSPLGVIGGGGVDPSALSGYIPKSAAQTDEANVHYSYLHRGNSWLKDTVSVYNTVYTETTSYDTTWHNYTVDLSNTNISTACPMMISITSDVTANAIRLTACDDSYSPVLIENWYAYPTDSTKLVFTAALKNKDIVHPSMSIAKLQIAQPTGGSDFTISITGSNNDVLATRNYVDNAVSTAGKTYTGVAPIVVNNTEDKISANCIELSAGNGIDSTKLALGVIEVSSQGGSNFSSSAFGINQSLQVTALTSLGYYDTGIGNSNQLSGNSTNNLGWTMPSAYANVKNDIITETMPEVSSHYSYKLSYTTPATGFTSNSGLEIRKYVGNTGTTRKVLSGNNTLGELVPEDYTSRQYLSTNAAGNMVWDDISNISPIVLVATSGDIPASGSSDGKVYIVTGNS